MINITKENLIQYFTKNGATETACKPDSVLLAAGVLIPIIDAENGLQILFTERTAHLKHHAGQISFPGGRMEAGDRDLIATTLRETREEIGLAHSQITLLGCLSPLVSSSGFLVTPFVGLLSNMHPLKIDPYEVASVFTAPLNFVLDTVNQTHEEVIFKGKSHKVYVIQYEQHRIWGLTAAVLVELRKRLLKNQT